MGQVGQLLAVLPFRCRDYVRCLACFIGGGDGTFTVTSVKLEIKPCFSAVSGENT
jgi:hypothetical protein